MKNLKLTSFFGVIAQMCLALFLGFDFEWEGHSLSIKE
jgi:hypothetical protein